MFVASQPKCDDQHANSDPGSVFKKLQEVVIRMRFRGPNPKLDEWEMKSFSVSTQACPERWVTALDNNGTCGQRTIGRCVRLQGLGRLKASCASNSTRATIHSTLGD